MEKFIVPNPPLPTLTFFSQTGTMRLFRTRAVGRGWLIADLLPEYHRHFRNLCRTTARELWPMFVTGELENQTEWAERLRKK